MDASGTDSAGHEKTALPVIADLGWAGLGYAQWTFAWLVRNY